MLTPKPEWHIVIMNAMKSLSDGKFNVVLLAAAVFYLNDLNRSMKQVSNSITELNHQVAQVIDTTKQHDERIKVLENKHKRGVK